MRACDQGILEGRRLGRIEGEEVHFAEPVGGGCAEAAGAELAAGVADEAVGDLGGGGRERSGRRRRIRRRRQLWSLELRMLDIGAGPGLDFEVLRWREPELFRGRRLRGLAARQLVQSGMTQVLGASITMASWPPPRTYPFSASSSGPVSFTSWSEAMSTVAAEP